MKSLLTLVCSFLIAITCFAALPAAAQPASETGSRPASGRWVSHQMNQPPPEVIEKNKLSKERVDEIRRLYLQAKKEQEDASKPGAKTRNSPPPAAISYSDNSVRHADRVRSFRLP